jgi:hypothetical protein
MSFGISIKAQHCFEARWGGKSISPREGPTMSQGDSTKPPLHHVKPEFEQQHQVQTTNRSSNLNLNLD